MTHSNKLARVVLDRYYRTAINQLLTSLRAAPAAVIGTSDKVVAYVYVTTDCSPH